MNLVPARISIKGKAEKLQRTQYYHIDTALTLSAYNIRYLAV